ncbi:TetR/AcrR family transcriptional regulator C-terminal domain-containing protein [Nonomuraea sp. NPDC050556]|uniref:TetR/AcrR family transcriptional regulator C-terminal domain-containing protein n=1 Tax=Nonomuraea sp. NPDC050556 TaxID=3364369 RepID=UPI00378F4DEA
MVLSQVKHDRPEREGPHRAFEASLTREIAERAPTVADPGLAARQLVMLVLNEAVDRSHYGLNPLDDAEIDRIVDEGVTLWSRAYLCCCG